jgi:dTDP-4-dehydrorhamnose 3,5-epimerase
MMAVSKTRLAGVHVLDPVRIPERGGFTLTAMSMRELQAHGLKAPVVQANISFNHHRGTLRGLHYQTAPATEVKLIRCLAGAIYDLVVDLRPGSPTFLQHFGVELSAENRRAIYVPEMFAHAYLTLTDGAEVFYQVSQFYTPACERGLRYDDPALGIEWPVPVLVKSEKDASWPLLDVRRLRESA